ncbi:hypothetical protein [Slackia isoflavoniconvertens]|uniref:hypothetical protein n=1 Tax=Slackia isoflavoniconvertens TaxID=572010 RepID=UPI003AB96B56
MLDFAQKLIECSYEFIARKHAESGDCFVDFFTNGQIHFHVLLRNESLKALTQDIVSRREISRAIVGLMAEWQHDRPGASGIDEGRILNGITFAMGGAYEYLYRCLADGENVDIAWLLSRTVRSHIVELGIDSADFEKRAAEFKFDEAFLVEANRYVLEGLREQNFDLHRIQCACIASHAFRRTPHGSGTTSRTAL